LSGVQAEAKVKSEPRPRGAAMSDFLTIGLKEAGDGRCVFPCIGKKPAVDGGHGCEDASADPVDIQAWAKKYPDANVGIVFRDWHPEVGVDVDKDNLPWLDEVQRQHGIIETRTVKTPGGGYHFYFLRPDNVRLPNIPKKAKKGFELKSDNQYLLAPGSIHPDTHTEYELIKDIEPQPMPDWLVKLALEGNGSKPVGNAPTTTKILEGEGRNQAITIEAGRLIRVYGDPEIVKQMIKAYNEVVCVPPLADEELERTVFKSLAKWAANLSPIPPTGINNSISLYCPGDQATESQRYKGVTKSVTKPSNSGEIVTPEKVEEWCKHTTGWFSYEEIDRELGINTPKDKQNRRVIIFRLKEAGKLESHPRDNKLMRYVNVIVRLIDFKSAIKRAPLALRFPFGIERYFNCYPGNIIVIAGAADAGKTAFLLNFVRFNMFDFSIFYQSSEMGKEELASRLENFEDITLDEWNFTAEERSHDFADVIRPDCINIIDYMELSDNFYMVADYLRAIHDKLASGIAIVALQKKSGADAGRGGEFGLEKPRLYLNMDSGKLKIRKAKNWTDPKNNPNGLTVNFKIVGGCKFILEQDWHKEQEVT
jgi:hypothetical protein